MKKSKECWGDQSPWVNDRCCVVSRYQSQQVGNNGNNSHSTSVFDATQNPKRPAKTRASFLAIGDTRCISLSFTLDGDVQACSRPLCPQNRGSQLEMILSPRDTWQCLETFLVGTALSSAQRVLLPISNPISSTLFQLANFSSTCQTDPMSPTQESPPRSQVKIACFAMLLKCHRPLSNNFVLLWFLWVCLPKLDCKTQSSLRGEITGIQRSGILHNILRCTALQTRKFRHRMSIVPQQRNPALKISLTEPTLYFLRIYLPPSRVYGF